LNEVGLLAILYERLLDSFRMMCGNIGDAIVMASPHIQRSDDGAKTGPISRDRKSACATPDNIHDLHGPATLPLHIDYHALHFTLTFRSAYFWDTSTCTAFLVDPFHHGPALPSALPRFRTALGSVELKRSGASSVGCWVGSTRHARIREQHESTLCGTLCGTRQRTCATYARALPSRMAAFWIDP
jgi:hypothetical protein